jgi:peptide/nickel transport system permease protein
MLAAFGAGLILGGIAGYFGDNRLKTRLSVVWGALTGLSAGLIWAWILVQTGWSVAGAISVVAFLGAAGRLFGVLLARKGIGQKEIFFPADLVIMRIAEIFNAVPRLILIVALAAMAAHQSTWLMILLIGLFSWTDVAVFIRAEMLRIREMDFIIAARGLGLSELRIIARHALPNALRPAMVVFAFGVGNAILLEASLSFLGFGGQDFQGVSWGSLLQNVVQHREAWWPAIPSGLAIGLTIYALNLIGESKSNRR